MAAPLSAIALEVDYPKIPGITSPGDPGFPGDPGDALPYFIKYYFALIVVVTIIAATVLITYAGILYLLSTGKPAQMTKARQIIESALQGLAIVLCSYLLLFIIDPLFLYLQSADIEKIELEEYKEEYTPPQIGYFQAPLGIVIKHAMLSEPEEPDDPDEKGRFEEAEILTAKEKFYKILEAIGMDWMEDPDEEEDKGTEDLADEIEEGYANLMDIVYEMTCGWTDDCSLLDTPTCPADRCTGEDDFDDLYEELEEIIEEEIEPPLEDLPEKLIELFKASLWIRNDIKQLEAIMKFKSLGHRSVIDYRTLITDPAEREETEAQITISPSQNYYISNPHLFAAIDPWDFLCITDLNLNPSPVTIDDLDIEFRFEDFLPSLEDMLDGISPVKLSDLGIDEDDIEDDDKDDDESDDSLDQKTSREDYPGFVVNPGIELGIGFGIDFLNWTLVPANLGLNTFNPDVVSAPQNLLDGTDFPDLSVIAQDILDHIPQVHPWERWHRNIRVKMETPGGVRWPNDPVTFYLSYAGGKHIIEDSGVESLIKLPYPEDDENNASASINGASIFSSLPLAIKTSYAPQDTGYGPAPVYENGEERHYQCGREIPVGETTELAWEHLRVLTASVDHYIEQGIWLLALQHVMNHLALQCDMDNCVPWCQYINLSILFIPIEFCLSLPCVGHPCPIILLRAVHLAIENAREEMQETYEIIVLLTHGHFEKTIETDEDGNEIKTYDKLSSNEIQERIIDLIEDHKHFQHGEDPDEIAKRLYTRMDLCYKIEPGDWQGERELKRDFVPNEDIRSEREREKCEEANPDPDDVIKTSHEIIKRKLDLSRILLDRCAMPAAYLEEVLREERAGHYSFFGPLVEEQDFHRYTKIEEIITGERTFMRLTSDFNWFCCGDHLF